MKVFFLLAALLLGLAVIYQLRKISVARKLLLNGTQGQGIIISQRVIEYRSSCHFVPKVRFVTAEGVLIEGESIGSEQRVEFFDGDEAYVLYDASQPTTFLFVQELGQTKNYLVLAFYSMMALAFAVGTIQF